ncbi:MAG: toll/interleukin-1 receptor domain-containing protein [Saprospiraceae bacterium]|nr:toll/interleukin-1 receptor domain-containing protein [Saprospiraceae bacterium]
MKEKIQQLISLGQTKDALQLLVQLNSDAILLQSQYNNGEKQFSLGLIDFGEWGRIQARVNFSALEMASKSVHPGTAPASQHSVSDSAQADNSFRVFVSYNHHDSEIANRMAAFLKNSGIRVSIDSEEMAPGQPIEEFIVEQIRGNGHILSLVSKSSLKSGWVGMESNLSLFASLLTETRFIPVMIDDALFDDDFFFEVAEELDAKTAELDAKIERAKKSGLGYGQFEKSRKRTVEHRQNLSKVFEHLRGVFVPDISGDKFDAGMGKVVATIKKP